MDAAGGIPREGVGRGFVLTDLGRAVVELDLCDGAVEIGSRGGELDGRRLFHIRSGRGGGHGDRRRRIAFRGEGAGRTADRRDSIADGGIPLVVRSIGKTGPGQGRGRFSRGERDGAEFHPGCRRRHVVIERELAVGVGLEGASEGIAHRRGVGFVSVGVDLVLRGLEGEVAQPRIAAVGPALVILENGVHGAPLEGIGATSFSMDVAAEHEEEVRIILQVVVDRLAVATPGGLGRRHAGADEPMARDDAAPVRMGLEEGIGPVHHRLIATGAGVVGEIDDDEIHPARAEEMVILIGRVVGVASAEIGTPGPPAHPEILVPETRVSTGPDVVVPRRATPRDAVGEQGRERILEDVHGLVGPDELGLGVVVVLRHVTHVGDELRVEQILRGDDPVGLVREELEAVASAVLGIKLGVGNRDDREILARRR